MQQQLLKQQQHTQQIQCNTSQQLAYPQPHLSPASLEDALGRQGHPVCSDAPTLTNTSPGVLGDIHASQLP
jgi:hypothetical protein